MRLETEKEELLELAEMARNMAVARSGMQHIAVYGYGYGYGGSLNHNPPSLLTFRIHCSSDDSKPNRGFGPRPPRRDNKVSICCYCSLICVFAQRRN